MTKRRYHMEAQELAAAEAAGSAHEPVTPRPAAAVILARDTSEGGQVLLVRRRSDVGFAAGAYVFPGGTLDPEDADPVWKDLMVPPAEESIAAAAEADGQPALATLRLLARQTDARLALTPSVPDVERQDR